MFYNSAMSLPILLPLSLLVDEWGLFVERYFPAAGDGGASPERIQFALGVGLSCVAGFWISFSSAWCLRVLSTTTYSVAGALNKLPVSVSGLVFFSGERNFGVGNVASILFSFVGGCFYSVGQLMVKEKSKQITNRGTGADEMERLLPPGNGLASSSSHHHHINSQGTSENA